MDPISTIAFAIYTFGLFQQIGSAVERTCDLSISKRRIFSILTWLEPGNPLRREDSLWWDSSLPFCIDQDYLPERREQVLQMEGSYREHSSEELLVNGENDLVSVQDFRKIRNKLFSMLKMLDERCVKEEPQSQTRSAINSSRFLVPLTSNRRSRSLLLESLIRSHLRDKKEAVIRARLMAGILRTNLGSRTLLWEYRLPMADHKDTSGNVLQSLVRETVDMASVLSTAEAATTTEYGGS